jgi:imidazolonepropionase-like amidohydrolase
VSGAETALVGGTIHLSPAEEPIQNGAILIQDGTIAAVGRKRAVRVPPAARVIDCSGLSITAGFWNSHVHFFERKWANAATLPASELDRQLADTFTRYGFTNVFDLSSLWENTRQLRRRIESGEVAGPRIRSTGEGLVPPGAVPSDEVSKLMGVMETPLPEISDAAQAAAAARKLLSEGVDGIKLFASSPRGTSLPEGAIRAAVDEARRSRKPVFVHPNNGADVLAALRAGADVVAHTTPRSGPWDEAILSATKQRRASLTPTLTIWKWFLRHDRFSTQEQVARTAGGQLRAWIEAGGTVLFGTDLGAVDPDPSEEYASMAEAGMSFAQILVSLTTAPATQFGESERMGRIAPGFQADLVVLKGDPSKDIRALSAVQYTLRAGKILHRP